MAAVPGPPVYAGPPVYVAKYDGLKKPQLPQGVRGILIHTSPKTLGGGLSPYVLRDDQGRLLENLWQFSKVYPAVSAQRIAKSRYHPGEIIWEHPAQVHCVDGMIQPAFWDWRAKGMAAGYAVRYPNGFAGRYQCLFSVPLEAETHSIRPPRLTYLQARRQIYCRLYRQLAPAQPDFAKLQALRAKGTPLCLIEVDGPDLAYYQGTPLEGQIEGGVMMRMDQPTIDWLLNDPGKPFGHGFALAALLLGGEEWLQ